MGRTFELLYFPPLDYCAALLSSEQPQFLLSSPWQKQSYRNRCYIDGPNGRVMLNIPIRHDGARQMADIKISYTENWCHRHQQAIISTYGQAPFFEALIDEIRAALNAKPQFLWQLNWRIMSMITRWLRLKQKPELLKDENPCGSDDFHPKKPSPVATFPPYPQTFDHRKGFEPNLSVLDLVFNEGPAAYDYLKELSLKMTR